MFLPLLVLIGFATAIASLVIAFLDPLSPFGKRSGWVAVLIGLVLPSFCAGAFGMRSWAWLVFLATPALVGACALLISRTRGNRKLEQFSLVIASALVGSFLLLVLVLSCQAPGPIDHPGLVFLTKIAIVFFGVAAGLTSIAVGLRDPDSPFGTRAGWAAICCGLLFGLFTWAVDPIMIFWKQSALIVAPIVPGILGILISWLLRGLALRVARVVIVAATIATVIFAGNLILLACFAPIAICLYDWNIDFLQSPRQAARNSPSETELKLIAKTRLDFQKSARLLYHSVDNFDGHENWLLLCPSGTHPVDSVKGHRIGSYGVDTHLPLIVVHLQAPDVGKLSPDGTPWFVTWTSDGDWTADVTPTDRGDYVDLVRNWDARGLRPQPVAKPDAAEATALAPKTEEAAESDASQPAAE